MASQLYAVYSVLVNPTTGAVSSLLNLYTDEYGTPAETGTLVRSYTGGGPNLLASLVDGTYKPNKTQWTEELSGTGGETIEVTVTGAGTANALISFPYLEQTRYFPAPGLALVQSQAYPAFFTYNSSETAVSEGASGYSSAITAVTPLSATSMEVRGTLDSAAESHILRYYPSAAPQTAVEIPLTGLASELFPVRLYGLTPETAYSVEIISTGPKGTYPSQAVSAATPAATQLAAPSFQLLATESGGAKRIVIADLAGADSFEVQAAAGGDWTGAVETFRVTNSSGAEITIRRWPESEGTSYAVRIRALAGSADYTDSPWSETRTVSVEIDPEEEESGPQNAELTVYANVAIKAEPSEPAHAVTLSKATQLIAEAVSGIGTTVHSVGGYTGTVTVAQLIGKAQADNQLIVHSSAASPNVNNLSMITSAATDSQLTSAKAVYHYVQNVRSGLHSAIYGHNHSYLTGADGTSVLAAPELDGDSTLVSEGVIAELFDPSVTYQAGAVVTDGGFLYRNTSGGTSAGNRDFALKWEKVTVADLIRTAANGGGGGRYETEFYGGDLDANHSIEITHSLGVQFVSVEVIDVTSGNNNTVTGAQVNLSSTSKCRVTFSSALPAASRIKAVVRA